MITLYTPGTGYEDLEAKIAFGLARLGMECTDDVSLVPLSGRYEVQIGIDDAGRLSRALATIAVRTLAGGHMYREPGISKKYASRYATIDATGGLKKEFVAADLPTTYGPPSRAQVEPFRRMMCGHDRIPAFGGSKGLIMAATAHVGMPSKRDAAASHDNLRLCSFCGTVALLAQHNFVFSTSADRQVVLTPVPAKPLNGPVLAQLQAAQKTSRGRLAQAPLPGVTLSLAFLALFPHVARLLLDASIGLHVAAIESGQQERLTASFSAITRPYAAFVAASPHNAATVRHLLEPKQPLVDPLVRLTHALAPQGLPACRAEGSAFARAFVAQVSPDSPRLLYHPTGRYLGEELLMIDPQIIENPAVNALASTLRYFVRGKLYGFVDNVRNARWGSHELERTLVNMLRQAQVEHAKEEGDREGAERRKPLVWLPADKDVQEVIRLAAQGPEEFEQVKLALALLALTRYRKADAEEAESLTKEFETVPDEEEDQ